MLTQFIDSAPLNKHELRISQNVVLHTFAIYCDLEEESIYMLCMIELQQ